MTVLERKQLLLFLVSLVSSSSVNSGFQNILAGNQKIAVYFSVYYALCHKKHGQILGILLKSIFVRSGSQYDTGAVSVTRIMSVTSVVSISEKNLCS